MPKVQHEVHAAIMSPSSEVGWCLQRSLDSLREELQATVAAKAAVLAAQEAGSSMAAQQEVRPCHAHTGQPPSLLSSLQLL